MSCTASCRPLRWLPPAALAAALALGLTACGGGDSSTATPSTSASAAAPASSGDPAASSSAPASSSKAPKAGKDNGIKDQDATAILDAAQMAASNASSLRFKGSVTTDGQTVALDLVLKSQEGAQGTVEVGGQQVELVVINPDIYIRGDDAFYASAAGPDAAKLFSGKWIKSSSSDPSFGDFASFTDISQLFKDEEGDTNAGAVKGEEIEVDGQPAIEITQGDSVVAVATTGKPYPLRITPKGAGAEGEVVFSDFDQPVTLTPPPADQVIDPAKLGAGG